MTKKYESLNVRGSPECAVDQVEAVSEESERERERFASLTAEMEAERERFTYPTRLPTQHLA